MIKWSKRTSCLQLTKKNMDICVSCIDEYTLNLCSLELFDWLKYNNFKENRIVLSDRKQ